jgi:hypothetical protein
MAKEKSKITLSTDHFASFLKAKEDLDKKIQAEGMIAVKEFLKEYFEKRPDVYGIKWTQYTPYFNDGEPCVFRLGGVSAFPTKEDFENGDRYDFESYNEEPETSLSQIEDILEVIFGDHTEVSATRDEITTEEYEHD